MYGSSQTGFIPNSCTTFALISMLHHWLEATDGTGYVRAALLDYRKASYPVDHNSLVTKLYSLRIKPTIFNWVVDFLGERTQCVKIHSDCFSEFTPVPTGIPQVTRIGLWLLLVMINDLHWSNANKFKPNSLKCKELRREFCRKANLDTPALAVNTNTFETVKSAKVPGITLRDDPK